MDSESDQSAYQLTFDLGDVPNVIPEAELEEAWLNEAGLSTLVSGTLGEGPAEALLSTLTRSQAAMVKKRLDNYTQTMRKRNKQPMRHVRDVFSTPDSSVSHNLSTSHHDLSRVQCGNCQKDVPLNYIPKGS